MSGDVVTKEQCDAVRIAAQECLRDYYFRISLLRNMFWPRQEGGTPTWVVEYYWSYTRPDCFDTLSRVWTKPVKEHFILHKLDVGKSYGSGIWTCSTAVEFLRQMSWPMDTYAPHLEVTKTADEFNAAREKSRLIIEEMFGTQLWEKGFCVSTADIDAEWASAVKNLPKAIPIEWSKGRPPSEWIRLLKDFGDEMSLDTFKRRRENGTFREHPDSTTKLVRLAIDDLPAGYTDKKKP
jgi:hypothetical protein